MAGPWSPWTAANLLFSLVTEGSPVLGGAAAVCGAISQAATAHGVEVRTDAPVERVIVERGQVTGVQLSGGERIKCEQLVCTSDPKSLFTQLIGARYLEPSLSQRSTKIRARGVTAVLDLALSKAPEDAAGNPIERLRTGASLDDLERAFDPVKYGEIPAAPIIDLRVSTDSSASGVTACALIHFVPQTPRDGWTAAARETLEQAIFGQLTEAAPGISDLMLGHRLRTPADLAAEYSLHGGHIFHGEHAPDQLLFMRPFTACAEFATPIQGLFLGGSGTHPGGGLTGVPGLLAARALLST